MTAVANLSSCDLTEAKAQTIIDLVKAAMPSNLRTVGINCDSSDIIAVKAETLGSKPAFTRFQFRVYSRTLFADYCHRSEAITVNIAINHRWSTFAI